MADAFKAVAVAIQTPGLNGNVGIPVILWGPPGVGKTKKLEAIVEAIKAISFLDEKGKPQTGKSFAFETVIAGLREPSDFAGLPRITDDGVILEAAAWAKRAAKADRAVIFLDEISTCAPATQKALLRAVIENVVGDLSMGSNVTWIAAANPPEQGADAFDLAPPTANRFIHLDVDAPSPQAWATYMLSGGGDVAEIPILDLAKFEDRYRSARALAGAYLNRFPRKLLDVPKDESKQGRAWPSPRSWEIGLRGYAAGMAIGGEGGEEIGVMLLAGAIGEGDAGQFVAWVREQDLPDPREVLRNPKAWEPDAKRLDRSIATLSACAAEALEAKVKNDSEREAMVEAAWVLVNQAITHKVPDVAIPAAIQLSSAAHARKGPKGKEQMAALQRIAPTLIASGIRV